MLSIPRGLRRPLLVVLAVVVWLGVGAVGGAAQGRLSQVQTNDTAVFLPGSAESTVAAQELEAFSDAATLPALVLLRPVDRGEVGADQVAAVQALASSIPDRAVPGGQGSWSQYLLADPVVVPAQDGAALMVVLSLDADAADELLPSEESVVDTFVVDLRGLLSDELGATAQGAGDVGLNAWVTGPAGFVADLVTAFGGIDGVLLAVALGAVLLILVAVYRSPFLPLVVILTAVFALSAAGLVVYRLAADGVLLLNGQAQGILSILVVGASVDYALLLVARYREELTRHSSPWTAMGVTWRAVLGPIAASAGTVAAGLLCLLLSDLGSNRSLGPVGAIGIASAFLAALTLLPALLLVAGRRSRSLFWPRVPRMGADELLPDPAQSDTHWGRLSRGVVRRARWVWPVTAAGLLVLAAFAPTFNAQGTSQSDYFLTQVDSVDGQEVLAEHFPAGAVQPAVVLVGQDQADAVLAAATDVAGVESATVWGGQPSAAGPAVEPVVVDGRVRIDVVTADAADTPEAVSTVADLRAAVHAVSDDALVGGAAAQTLDAQLAAEHDLRVIVPVVLAVIVVILMLLLRSVVAAVVLLVANVLSFAAALGVASVAFRTVFGWPSADPVVPLYGFVFLVALGVDYSIFLMTRVREEVARSGVRTGVVRGLAVTGGVITSAGIVLAVTFAALGVIPLLFLAQLAFIVAFGVLLDTFVVRTLLVPALVVRLGRRAWWPGDPAREAESGRTPSQDERITV